MAMATAVLTLSLSDGLPQQPIYLLHGREIIKVHHHRYDGSAVAFGEIFHLPKAIGIPFIIVSTGFAMDSARYVYTDGIQQRWAQCVGWCRENDKANKRG